MIILSFLKNIFNNLESYMCRAVIGGLCNSSNGGSNCKFRGVLRNYSYFRKLLTNLDAPAKL